MARFLSALSTKQILVEQMPVIVVSTVIAEMFYKFHSFTLECLAFLATWFVLDWIVARCQRAFPARPGDAGRL